MSESARPGHARDHHRRAAGASVAVDRADGHGTSGLLYARMGGAPARGYYAEGHSATRIHPEFQDLKVGDLVDYGGGNLVPVHAIEPFRHLVHAEAFVLRPLQ